MDDGVVLRADVFRPVANGKYPVILNYGPYAKGHAFQDSRKFAWERMIKQKPEVAAGSTNKYQNWEVVDPEKWVPDGYAIVRVDSRGTGRSPGYVDPWSPRETKDLYDCIEWSAAQSWCSGKVGLNGISYFAMNAWQVAALEPPHLAALCAWEGAADHYRETCYHGGIYSEFISNWYPRAIVPVQHGVGERGARSRVTGEPVAGPETLSPEELEKNRRDIITSALEHPFDDDYHRERSANVEKITVPFLSAANWGGQGIHPRGNFEVFMRAPVKTEVAGSAWRHPLARVLYRLRGQASEAFLWPLPEGRGYRLEQAASGTIAGSSPRREIRRAARATNGRSPVPSGRSSILTRTIGA